MHLPYPRPQSQVSFLSLPIAFHDSHRSFTDPKHKARSHHIPPLMLPRDPEQIHRFAGHNQPIIIISSSPTALITMHNLKRFLEDSAHVAYYITHPFFSHPKCSFSPSQARTRATAEGNLKSDDLIAIYRKLPPSMAVGRKQSHGMPYFVVDSVEALSKFGTDVWERVVRVMTTDQVWQFRPYKWNEPRQLFYNGVYISVYIMVLIECANARLVIVKGIYVLWSNDPSNTKIKDWNITELKVRPPSPIISSFDLLFRTSTDRP